MAPSMDYNQEYQRANAAYVQGDYGAAAEIIDRLVTAEPGDANARLLRGHIYCYGLQQYGVAQDDYQAVLTLTTDPKFLEYAQTGLQDVAQGLGAEPSVNGHGAVAAGDGGQFADLEFDFDDISGIKAETAGAASEAGEASEGFGIVSLDDLELGDDVDVDTGLSLGPVAAAEGLGAAPETLAGFGDGSDLDDPLVGLAGKADDPFAAIASDGGESFEMGADDGDPFASMAATDAMGMGAEASVAPSADAGFADDPFGGMGDGTEMDAGETDTGGDDPFGLGTLGAGEDALGEMLADGSGDDPFGLETPDADGNLGSVDLEMAADGGGMDAFAALEDGGAADDLALLSTDGEFSGDLDLGDAPMDLGGDGGFGSLESGFEGADLGISKDPSSGAESPEVGAAGDMDFGAGEDLSWDLAVEGEEPVIASDDGEILGSDAFAHPDDGEADFLQDVPFANEAPFGDLGDLEGSIPFDLPAREGTGDKGIPEGISDGNLAEGSDDTSGEAAPVAGIDAGCATETSGLSGVDLDFGESFGELDEEALASGDLGDLGEMAFGEASSLGEAPPATMEGNPFGDGVGDDDNPFGSDGLAALSDSVGADGGTDVIAEGAVGGFNLGEEDLSDSSMFSKEDVSEPSVTGLDADAISASNSGSSDGDDSISDFLHDGMNLTSDADGGDSDRTEFVTELMVEEGDEPLAAAPVISSPRPSSAMPPIPDSDSETVEETLFMMPQGLQGDGAGVFGEMGDLEGDDAFDLGLMADAQAFTPLPDEESLQEDPPDMESGQGGFADPVDGGDEDAFSIDELATDLPSMSAITDSSAAAGSDFMDDLDEFDDLGSLPDFSLTNANAEFADSDDDGFSLADGGRTFNNLASTDNEIFNIGGARAAQEDLLNFDQPESRAAEPVVATEGSLLAPFDNARLNVKQLMTALAAGLVSTLTVSGMAYLGMSFAKDQGADGDALGEMRRIGLLSAIVAGASSGGVAWFLGRRASRQLDQSTVDLQVQFDSVCQGNLNATAKVFGDDEFGDLANGFNQMMRVISSTMGEAQRKAQEQEQAREDLQRQVIRLLDDVEGAARGDLTVQAEVTADVLGAVADSFNLTIQNLREIVQQVKSAARKVNEGSSENEAFARALSSDALRQAEELAVTLNSVQVMTDSIQRVAESASEAEEVARSASSTALKGGEAVERTVAGILQIRETVAETTRKVKRLAESSQEISKIVALISTIASRTNLLALNASIEAARAGEAGKGFAIVADEVRQLADRSAKSLKEIEKIVMQIQGETSSVMAAMEEGTQQVIEGTKLAEQAKRSLDDIIQVSNRIDVLVRSITADTVEQTETSKSVAQVVRSVEKTAQDTSHEAQRVSGSLQSLVGVARDLLTSVERFRVE